MTQTIHTAQLTPWRQAEKRDTEPRAYFKRNQNEKNRKVVVSIIASRGAVCGPHPLEPTYILPLLKRAAESPSERCRKYANWWFRTAASRHLRSKRALPILAKHLLALEACAESDEAALDKLTEGLSLSLEEQKAQYQRNKQQIKDEKELGIKP